MPTYIMLSTVTDEGSKTIKKNPGRIKEVNEEIEALGVKWSFLAPTLAPSLRQAYPEGSRKAQGKQGPAERQASQSVGISK